MRLLGAPRNPRGDTGPSVPGRPPRKEVMPSSSLQALLARANAALERGHGAEAAQLLTPALRSSALTRDDELLLRSMLAEAWLLQDDLDQAATALGRPPDTFRDTVAPGRLTTLWRLHGRLASARGDQSRAIALHGRALKQAEAAHDSRAMGALRQAERLAGKVHADDVLATICGNQAGVMVMEHRYEQALVLAERSVMLQEAHGSGHGLAVALGNLGQICVRLGDLDRAADVLHRALELRSPIQFHETTGAVFDTLVQVHMIRGDYETAADFLARAGEAYGAYGRQTSQWYEWSVRVLNARLALRRGALDQAVSLADEILQAGAPPFDALQATLIAAEALTLADRLPEAEQRLNAVADTIDPKRAPAAWGEYLRLRGSLHAKTGSAADAYHDFAQSAALLDMLGERYQAALSHLALGRLVAQTGARSVAERHLAVAQGVFEQLGARRDSGDTLAARDLLTVVGTGEYVISPADADDAIVRRIVDAAALPDLLGRETATAMLEAAAADSAIVFARLAGGRDVKLVASIGVEGETARALARSAVNGQTYGRGVLFVEGLGRDADGE